MAISLLAVAAAAYSPNFAAPQLAPTAAAAHLAALRPHPVACAPGDDERDETAQFLQILGGLSLGCVGVFSGASALGADDVVAGNLVLVASRQLGNQFRTRLGLSAAHVLEKTRRHEPLV